MRKPLMAIMSSSSFLITAAAQTGLYTQMHVGPAFGISEIKVDDNKKVGSKIGWHGGAELGFKSAQNLRYAFELSYHTSNKKDHREAIIGEGETLNKWTISSLNAMVNVYYDFDGWIHDRLTPYLGIGLGCARIKIKRKHEEHVDAAPTVEHDSVTKARLAFQWIAGTAFPLTPHLSATTDYRYFRAAKFENYALSHHTVNFGLLYRF